MLGILLLASCRSGVSVAESAVSDEAPTEPPAAGAVVSGDVCQPGPAAWSGDERPAPNAERKNEASDLMFSVWNGSAGVMRRNEAAGDFRNLSLSLYRIPIVEGEPTSGPHDAQWWAATSLELEGPSETQTVGGDALLELFEPADFERGATLVVEMAAQFSLSALGTHTARWNTPDGTLELSLVVLEQPDYLRCRLHTDTVHNG